MILKGNRLAPPRKFKKYTPSRTHCKHKASFLDGLSKSRYARLIIVLLIALLLIIIFVYMSFTRTETHSQSSSDGSTHSTAVPYPPNFQSNLITSEELEFLNYTNTARTRNQIPSSVLRPLIQNTKDDIHIVFSTGCSEYQNWQSEVLLYSWTTLNHPGQITRIVSGCKNLKEKESALKTAIVSERVHLFFTPNYTPLTKDGNRPFHYFNKPFSMRKFVHEIDIAESVLVLLDPDMIITKVFKYHLPEVGEQFQVKKGHPVSQKYGIGSKWVSWKLCETESCQKVTDRIADDQYSVGPPYMMHIDDWRLITNEWVSYSPGALEKEPSPSILAEMYSYSIACAHHDLPHQLIDSMVSSPDAVWSEPAWKSVSWNWKDGGSNTDSEELHIHILHYCQGYWLGDTRNTGHMINYGFNFHKGHLPKDILHNCDRTLLVEPPTNQYAFDRDHTSGNWNVWMLYQLITRINNALANYKQTHCGDSWSPRFTTVLRQPEADTTNKMHYFLDK